MKSELFSFAVKQNRKHEQSQEILKAGSYADRIDLSITEVADRAVQSFTNSIQEIVKSTSPKN